MRASAAPSRREGSFAGHIEQRSSSSATTSAVRSMCRQGLGMACATRLAAPACGRSRLGGPEDQQHVAVFVEQGESAAALLERLRLTEQLEIGLLGLAHLVGEVPLGVVDAGLRPEVADCVRQTGVGVAHDTLRLPGSATFRSPPFTTLCEEGTGLPMRGPRFR